MSRQVLELDHAAQVRDLGCLEVGNGCLHDTARLVRDQLAVPGVSSSLLDNVGMLCRHLDDIDDVRLQAGAHFVFSPQWDETPGDGCEAAHCIVCKPYVGL